MTNRRGNVSALRGEKDQSQMRRWSIELLQFGNIAFHLLPPGFWELFACCVTKPSFPNAEDSLGLYRVSFHDLRPIVERGVDVTRDKFHFSPPYDGAEAVGIQTQFFIEFPAGGSQFSSPQKKLS